MLHSFPVTPKKLSASKGNTSNLKMNLTLQA